MAQVSKEIVKNYGYGGEVDSNEIDETLEIQHEKLLDLQREYKEFAQKVGMMG